MKYEKGKILTQEEISKIDSFDPHTKYKLGDLVIIKSLNSTSWIVRVAAINKYGKAIGFFTLDGRRVESGLNKIG